MATALATPAGAGDLETIAGLVDQRNYRALHELGPGILPDLVTLYEERTDDLQRELVAGAFYQLGWPSEEAADVLMRDVVDDEVAQRLRITAQYALGRVSNDDAVVQALLHNMRQGRTFPVRDKAACALAHDQIHLSERQKIALFRALVKSLDDPKPDVRRIAFQALKIHTGQTRGYRPNKPREKRLAAMLDWLRWLNEYEANL